MKDLIQTIFIGACIAGLLMLVINPYRVRGQSMYPTLRDGQFVIVDKISLRLRNPNPGEIVVAMSPMGGEVVKRVIRETEDGKFWLEGDNKDASTDSRSFGAVDKGNFRGRVVLFNLF